MRIAPTILAAAMRGAGASGIGRGAAQCGNQSAGGKEVELSLVSRAQRSTQ